MSAPILIDLSKQRPRQVNGNRYSVVCDAAGCLESRATRLRRARRIAWTHIDSGCRAEVSISHWHVNDERKAKPKAPRLIEVLR